MECQHMKMYEEVKVRLLALLTSTEDESVRLYTPLLRLPVVGFR